MARFYPTGTTGGGAGSDGCTGTPAELMKGYTAILKGSGDEPVEGQLELTGNAQADHVLSGETFYTTDPKNRLTGTMTVNSILSFEVAPYSGRRVLAKWQNPNPTPGKPFGGVIIKCMAGRYPAWNEPDGNLATAVYAGVGNNTAPGGWSQVFMDMPNLNTTYYFTCFGYARTSFGYIYSPVYDQASIKQATAAIGGTLNVTITGTQNYTIPGGFSMMDLFGIGAGGSGYQAYNGSGSIRCSGDGGGSGYTHTVKNIPISEGQVLACVVGSGGISSNGGGTSVSRSGVTLLSAAGGGKSGGGLGGNGGSGGGGGTRELSSENYGSPGSGGQNGNNGSSGYVKGGKGQGTTTRAFGEASGTLYGDGGGAGGAYGTAGAVGGSGLGGRGGERGNPGMNGTPNTGSGGGGAGASGGSGGAGGRGGILLRLY